LALGLSIGGDAGFAEGVVADAPRLDAGLLRPALDHRPCALPVETGSAERIGLAVHGPKERAVFVLSDSGGLDVLPMIGKQMSLSGR